MNIWPNTGYNFAICKTNKVVGWLVGWYPGGTAAKCLQPAECAKIIICTTISVCKLNPLFGDFGEFSDSVIQCFTGTALTSAVLEALGQKKICGQTTMSRTWFGVSRSALMCSGWYFMSVKLLQMIAFDLLSCIYMIQLSGLLSFTTQIFRWISKKTCNNIYIYVIASQSIWL